MVVAGATPSGQQIHDYKEFLPRLLLFFLYYDYFLVASHTYVKNNSLLNQNYSAVFLKSHLDINIETYL